MRTAHGDVLQVPLTYRDAPLDGADDALLGIAEHSHLGRRWIYDGCGDPVYAQALAATILTGGREAEQWVQEDDGRERREVPAHVVGSGTPGAEVPVIDAVTVANGPTATTINASRVELVVQRRLAPTRSADDAWTLTGTWPGRDEPALLAFARH